MEKIKLAHPIEPYYRIASPRIKHKVKKVEWNQNWSWDVNLILTKMTKNKIIWNWYTSTCQIHIDLQFLEVLYLDSQSESPLGLRVEFCVFRLSRSWRFLSSKFQIKWHGFSIPLRSLWNYLITLNRITYWLLTLDCFICFLKLRLLVLSSFYIVSF